MVAVGFAVGGLGVPRAVVYWDQYFVRKELGDNLRPSNANPTTSYLPHPLLTLYLEQGKPQYEQTPLLPTTPPPFDTLPRAGKAAVWWELRIPLAY